MKRFIFGLIFFFIFSFVCSKPSFSEEEILILLDSSLSMGETVSDRPKYDIAVDAVKNYLNSVDRRKKIGFRIIGLQLNQNLLSYISNPDLLCKGTQLLNPISYNNSENINMSLNNVFPLGVSPLTYSLKTSIENDFSQAANPKHIILITDGAESCNEDPCLYARQVSSVRSDIKIDIFAIDVNSGDLIQLKCISDATNGKIYNIKNSSDFNSAFNQTMQNNTPNIYTVSPNRQDVIYRTYLIETIE